MNVFPTDRPLTATEIMARYKRPATTAERQRYSAWRTQNPDVPLGPADPWLEPSSEASKDEFYYMPASARSLDTLTKVVGPEAAEAIKALIVDLISERNDL